MGVPPADHLATDPATTVRAFFAALEDGAVTQALELTDSGIVWRNTSLPTVKGGLVARVLKGMDRDWMRLRADFHHIAADGRSVLTHRTDHLRIGPVEIDFWVWGTFELTPEGRIVLWHDYFSWTNVLGGTVRGLLRMVSRPRRAPSRR